MFWFAFWFFWCQVSKTTWNVLNCYVNLTNRFHVAVRLFNSRSQLTTKWGKNKKTKWPWRDNLCELWLVRCNFHYVTGISGILPYTQESYLTNIPLDHSRFFLLGWLIGNHYYHHYYHFTNSVWCLSIFYQNWLPYWPVHKWNACILPNWELPQAKLTLHLKNGQVWLYRQLSDYFQQHPCGQANLANLTDQFIKC